jgi:hypothetical protein
MTKPKDKNFEANWAKAIAKAWSDEKFKQKLINNPEQTLKEFGIEAPKDYQFQIHEEKNKVIHLYIPPKPEGELSEEDIKKVAGGAFGCICVFGDK